jgi:hypothetical protein
MVIVRARDLSGGLSKREKSIIKDNQLAIATNVFYDQDKNLRTRGGTRAVGEPIPDNASIVDDCNDTTGFTVADDAINLSTGTAKRGTFSVQFDIDVSASANDTAILEGAIGSLDITNLKGYLTFWLFVPTGFNSNLTNVVFRYGSDSTNYYEWTLASLTENDWNYIKLNYSDATTIGTPVDTAMDYVRLQINYTSAYLDKTGIRIDAINTYSATSNKPMMSLKFFRTTTVPAIDYLFSNVGTGFYLYHPTGWELLKSGLTEGLRFGFMAYKNVMYFGNGTDNYFSFDGTAITEHTGADTYRGPFMLLANDIGYITDPNVPTSVAYTNGTPTDLNTFPNVVVADQDDSSGSITGLINLGPLVIVTKERKIYQLNITAPSLEQLDYSDGAASHRSLVRVENSVYFLNEKGVFDLAQRQATVGSLRADAKTNDIQPLINAILDKSVTAGIYVNKLNNYYLFVDTSGDGVNDTVLVWSVLTQAWTQYQGISANEAVVYPDFTYDDLEESDALLIASSLNGQMIQMEYGTNDQGAEILFEIETKTADFGTPEEYKVFHNYEFFGFINEGGQLTFSSTLGETTVTADAVLQGSTYSANILTTSQVLGGSLLGGSPLGGGEASITLFPFVIRVPVEQTENNIAINVFTDYPNTVAVFTKWSVDMDVWPRELFPNAYIA